MKSRKKVASAEHGATSPVGSATPLTRVNRGLREIQGMLADLTTNTRGIEGKLREVQANGSGAWRETEAMRSAYYSVLRDVLAALDDCQGARDCCAQMGVVEAGLRKLLLRQKVEPMAVKARDRFDAEMHECQETIEAPEDQNGAIVEVIRLGYTHRDGEGKQVVLRPAWVRVGKASVVEKRNG